VYLGLGEKRKALEYLTQAQALSRAEGGSGRGIPDAHLHDEIGE